MSYRIAFDGGKDGLVLKNWLDAAAVRRLPHAFAVKDSMIIWQGSPSDLYDAFVQSLLA